MQKIFKNAFVVTSSVDKALAVEPSAAMCFFSAGNVTTCGEKVVDISSIGRVSCCGHTLTSDRHQMTPQRLRQPNEVVTISI